MNRQTEPREVNRQYIAAYKAHYTEHNLTLALRLYKQVMASHPSVPEAEYSRMQIQNIVNATVPIQELLDVQTELAQNYLKKLGAI